MLQYFFIDDVKPALRLFYNVTIVCLFIYLAFGVITGAIMMHFMSCYLVLILDVFKSTLEDAKQIKEKKIREQKLMLAYKQHIFMLR